MSANDSGCHREQPDALRAEQPRDEQGLDEHESLDTRVEDVRVGRGVVEVSTGRRVHLGRAIILACGVAYRFHRRMGYGLPSGA